MFRYTYKNGVLSMGEATDRESEGVYRSNSPRREFVAYAENPRRAIELIVEYIDAEIANLFKVKRQLNP